ncbi:unnamed protein product [Closterium sp. NIES-53]
MTVKEALASWKGKAVITAMEEEIRSLNSMGTWELVKLPRGVNIMKNRWVRTTKYRIDDTVEREKARLVVKGFTQVYGADYVKTYVPVSSYVTLRIFLSIVGVLNLNLIQLDMKNTFLQSKLDRVLYMYQPDHFNDGTDRALDDVLMGAGWRKSRVDEALYFNVGADGVACWVLVYVDDLLVASNSIVMLKELLEAAFELRYISPMERYLGLEIVCDRPARKLWLHQQGYDDKLRGHFIDKEKTGRTPKTPISVDAYAYAYARRRNANNAGDKQKRTSTGGYAFSEYVAATEAGKEGRRLRFLLAQFRQLDAGTPTVLRMDNKSAITVDHAVLEVDQQPS